MDSRTRENKETLANLCIELANEVKKEELNLPMISMLSSTIRYCIQEIEDNGEFIEVKYKDNLMKTPYINIVHPVGKVVNKEISNE